MRVNTAAGREILQRVGSLRFIPELAHGNPNRHRQVLTIPFILLAHVEQQRLTLFNLAPGLSQQRVVGRRCVAHGVIGIRRGAGGRVAATCDQDDHAGPQPVQMSYEHSGISGRVGESKPSTYIESFCCHFATTRSVRALGERVIGRGDGPNFDGSGCQ